MSNVQLTYSVHIILSFHIYSQLLLPLIRPQKSQQTIQPPSNKRVYNW